MVKPVDSSPPGPGAVVGSVIGCLDRKAVDVHGEPPEVAAHPGSETDRLLLSRV